MADPLRPGSPFVSRRVGSLAPTLHLRTIRGLTVPYANGRPLTGFERQRHRRTLDLSGQWRRDRVSLDHQLSLTDRSTARRRIEAEGGGRHLPAYDDSGWLRRRIPLPENELREGEPPVAERYENGVWYRRTVELRKAPAGQRVRLNFLAVNYIADVWVNGRWAGYHEGGYTPFSLDVTELLADGRNLIAVRVDNPPWDSRTDIVPAVTGDWWNYTGIIQDVYLEWVPRTSVARVDVVPDATGGDDPGEQAQLTVTVAVDGATAAKEPELSVRFTLAEATVDRDRLGTPFPEDLIGPATEVKRYGAGRITIDPTTGDGVAQLVGVLERPRLWTPENPHLYVLTVELLGRRGILDRYSTQVGVRTVGLARSEPVVLLNGRAVAFQGAARHEDWADSGRTVLAPSRVVRDLLDIRGLGATLLRTAHYPNHPLTYLVADRIGLAVVEEIPTWWFETYHFADQELRGIAQQMWREMIFRDYNRPSVLFWSATNEAVSIAHRGAFLHRVSHDLRTRYDDGRLVTQSAAPNRPGPDDPTQQQVDVAGWTSYFGVLDECEGEEASRTKEFLAKAHDNHPRKPVLVTEFGMWASADDRLAVRQREVFERTWPAYQRDAEEEPSDFVVGCVWWAAYDWRTHLAGVNTFGLSHLDRERHRPVRAALHAAYRAAPPSCRGAVRPRRRLSAPRAVPIATGELPAPDVLADFLVEDSVYPVRDARVERAPLTAAGGRWAMRMIPTGPRATAGIYLYHRPVQLTEADELQLRLLDPAGGRRLLVRLRDTRGVVEGQELIRATPANQWDNARLPLTRFRQVDLNGIERLELVIADRHSRPVRKLYLDTVRRVRLPRQQRYANGGR